VGDSQRKPSLATLIAAFFGAWFAFSLQSRTKKKEERNKKISSILSESIQEFILP